MQPEIDNMNKNIKDVLPPKKRLHLWNINRKRLKIGRGR